MSNVFGPATTLAQCWHGASAAKAYMNASDMLVLYIGTEIHTLHSTVHKGHFRILACTWYKERFRPGYLVRLLALFVVT